MQIAIESRTGAVYQIKSKLLKINKVSKGSVNNINLTFINTAFKILADGACRFN